MLRRALLFCTQNPIRFFAFSFAGSAVLAVLWMSVSGFLEGRAEPGRGASWIWAEEAAKRAQPIAFWAARDVVISDSVDLKDVALVIAADEAYELWLNGQRVGLGARAADSKADQYDVSSFLQLGRNRVLVELRSSRGAGGLLLNLRAGERMLLETDSSWRIIRELDLRVLRGSVDLAGLGEPAKVWGHSAAGRFKVSDVELRPTIRRSWLNHSTSDFRHPERWRQASDLLAWRPISRGPGRSAKSRLPGRQSIYDFGAEIQGVLELEFAEEGEAGLLFFDVEEPEAATDRPDVVVSPFPGRRDWRDTRPRRFRYVAMVGLPALRGIRVTRSQPDSIDLDSTQAPITGVFGLPPAQSYLPVEEAIWDRLKGGPGAE